MTLEAVRPGLVVALVALAGCAAAPEPEVVAASCPSARAGVVPVSAAPPNYPRDALMRGAEGSVRMCFTIAPDGSVSDVRVAESDPVKVFDAAATRALSRWRFDPADAGPATYTITFEIGR